MASPLQPNIRTHGMIARLLSATAAQHAVIDTPELFEQILLHLPIEDVVALRRLDVYTNSLILTSRPILRKLFLLAEEPNTKDPSAAVWKINRSNFAVTPSKANDTDLSDEEGNDLHARIAPGILNPLLLTDSSDAKKHKMKAKDRWYYCDTLALTKTPSLKILPSFIAADAGEADFLDYFYCAQGNGYSKGALALNMYISQPPCKIIEMDCHYFVFRGFRPDPSRDSSRSVRFRIESEEGIRFGDLLKGMLEHIARVTRARPGRKWYVRKAMSAVWGIGVIFPTAREMETVMREDKVKGRRGQGGDGNGRVAMWE